MEIRRFEDIEAGQLSRELTRSPDLKSGYELTKRNLR